MSDPTSTIPQDAAQYRPDPEWKRGSGPTRRPGFGALAGSWRLLRGLCEQERHVFPGSRSCGQACARVEPCGGVRLMRLRTSTGHEVAALHAAALDPAGAPLAPASGGAHPPRPAILFFYGNDSYLARALPLMHLLRRAGADVLVPEYPGYGLSAGRPSEAACYATADAAYELLCGPLGVARCRVVAAGASLGGAVAIDLAARRQVAGVATFLTFTSIADVARLAFPFAPRAALHRLLRHRFDSLAKMPRLACPVMIGHSTGDSLIPYAMADALARAAGGPVTRLHLEGVEHHPQHLLDLAGEQIRTAMEAFVGRVAR